MLYSLKQRLFFVLKFLQLDHSVFETTRSLQMKFNTSNGITIEALTANFQRTGNFNDDLTRPHAAITDAIVEVVQQVIQQRSGVSAQRVAALNTLRRMSMHRIMHLSFNLSSYRIETPPNIYCCCH